MTLRQALAAAIVLSLAAGAPAIAQPAAPAAPAAMPLTPYGQPLTLEMAKKALAAAEAFAIKNEWPMAIAIIDSGGHLVLFEKMDNTQLVSIGLAEGKARTALEFRRATKVLEDAIAGGGAGLRLTALHGITPLEGGMLIVVDGKIVGAIGVSGMLSSQDIQVAKAGADALTR